MLRVITLFSGYDSQCLALDRLGTPYELVRWCEIDRHAIKAHNALFPQWAGRNLGDISQVDWSQVPPCDLLTYSSPCQDFSTAGLQRGGTEGSGTRSSLLWECRKAIEALRPKYLLFENVPALAGKKFIATFRQWQDTLTALGYTNHWQLLNAKDYGVPQNRNRVFMVSIRGEHQPYYFPKPFPLERRLRDVLETNVPERYYLSDERVKRLLASTAKEREAGRGFAFAPKDGTEAYANAITSKAGSRKTGNFIAEPNCRQVAQLHDKKQNQQSGRIYDTDGISPTLDCATGGNRPPKVVIVGNLQPDNNRPKSGVIRQQNMVVSEHGISPCIPATHTMHEFKIAVFQPHPGQPHPETTTKIISRPHGYFRGAEYEDCAPTAKSSAYVDNNFIDEQQVLGWTRDAHGNVIDRHPVDVANCVTSAKRDNTQNYVQVCTHIPYIRIRLLTERELFRIMDVSEPDIDTLISAGISKTQLAKMAGNSIVVAVLCHIFHRLLIDTEAEPRTQLKIF